MVALRVAILDSSPRQLVIEAPGVACMSFSEAWWPSLPSDVYHQARAGATEVVITPAELRAIVGLYESLNAPPRPRKVVASTWSGLASGRRYRAR